MTTTPCLAFSKEFPSQLSQKTGTDQELFLCPFPDCLQSGIPHRGHLIITFSWT